MELLHPPTFEPVTLAEVRAAARLDDVCGMDGQLPGMIRSARALAEQIAGRFFVSQTWRYEAQAWPTCPLPVYGATAVAMSYWDGSAWVDVDSSAFEFAPMGSGTAVAAALDTKLPTPAPKALRATVRVDITSGYASRDLVPPEVKTFVKAVVVSMIDNPGTLSDAAQHDVHLYASLLDSVKVY